MDENQIKNALAPYRARIDALDKEIIDLLRARYDVIEEVADIKLEHNIDAVLQYRVDEVRENAAKDAASKGLDEDFIRHLYAQLIEHSCNLEDKIKNDKAA